MKDDRRCEYCTYKNVRTQFSPCLGCSGNMDHLIQERKDGENYADETRHYPKGTKGK